MIEVNNYKTGKFQTVTTGFKTAKSSVQKKKKTLGDFLDDSLLDF